MTSPSDWTSLADPKRAIRTGGLWESDFKDWGETAQGDAKNIAATGFRPIAEVFLKERKASLEKERAAQNEWLVRRSEEITGAASRERDLQPGLFDFARPEPSFAPVAAPDWADLKDPAERLAAFHADRAQRPAARSEAEGVLRIFKQRNAALDGLLDFKPPEVIPLGLLMLIPEAGNGA